MAGVIKRVATHSGLYRAKLYRRHPYWISSEILFRNGRVALTPAQLQFLILEAERTEQFQKLIFVATFGLLVPLTSMVSNDALEW